MILIVDDDETTLFLMKRVIKSIDQQNQILTARNGEEALTKLNHACSVSNCPDLILLDINMPVMNGFEFLQELEHTNLGACCVKVAILTSFSNPIDYIMAQQYPIYAFLEKLLTEDQFRKVAAA